MIWTRSLAPTRSPHLLSSCLTAHNEPTVLLLRLLKCSGSRQMQVDDVGLRGASWASLGPSGHPWQLRQLLRPVPFYGTVPCGRRGAWAWGRKGQTHHSLTLCGRTLLRGLCYCRPFRSEARGGDLNSLRWFMSVSRPGMLV